jgi:hypothetical protein
MTHQPIRTIQLVFIAILAVSLPACAQLGVGAPRSQCTGQPPAPPPAGAGGAPESIDLTAEWTAGRLRFSNRTATRLDGDVRGVYVSEGSGPGVIWIERSGFTQGTIDLAVCGRDVSGQSFVGVAFHRQSDTAYEAVYVRPFNFRASNPTQHQHAVQYMALPDYDWPRLRQEFPEEFENPVDASVAPTGWVPLRVVVAGPSVRIYVGPLTTPALEVRRLGTGDRGLVGLWVGNGSDGAFAGLRLTTAP